MILAKPHATAEAVPGARIHRHLVDELMSELHTLETKRRELLKRIAEADIAAHGKHVIRYEGAVGDANLFCNMSKARLLEIIESYWRVHHMGMPEKFLKWGREELVNYVCDIKGLPGSYKRTSAQAPR